MSSYLRSISNKFTSFVIIRRQVTNINQQLTNHVRLSLPVLEECLGERKDTEVEISPKEKDIKFIVPVSSHNPSHATFHCDTTKQKLLGKKRDYSKHQVTNVYQLMHMINTEINLVNSDITNISILYNNGNFAHTRINLKTKEPHVSYLEINSLKGIFDNVLLNSQKDCIYNTEISPNVNEKQTSEDRKPSEGQLQSVFDTLQYDLPKLFVQQMDYRIYTQDMVFVNNIRGVTTVGVQQYFKQIVFLKIVGHLRFAFVKFNILKMTMHPEDNSIKVRWRITGVSGTKVFIQFWKLKLWNVKEHADSQPAWYDGFSIFYVNDEGKVFKHVVDKMMPDQNIQEKMKTPMETKLALFSTLLDVDSDCSTKFCSGNYPQLSRIK